MRAAIYARKSTDDNDRNAADKSITRQVEHATAYAVKKGWAVEEEHIFVDDGISGAEYQNRPGFLRLLNSLKHFDVLIMSESSRLGRDMTRNASSIVEIIESGVRIFYYLSDEEEKADTPEQKIMMTLRSFASEVERQKASQRARDALERKARQGYNTGGVVYGYDNVPVYATATDGKQVKSHTDYSINPEQGAVIRNIFEMYAAGYGHVTIAKTLNGDPRYEEQLQRFFGGVTPPKPVVGNRGTGSWSPSSIRAMLYNERYIGKIPFGEYRNVYRKGTQQRQRQDEYLKADRPDLRIIPEDLWGRVQERLTTVAKTYIRNTDGKLWGRPGNGIDSRYLLTGFGRCGVCGANFTMIGGSSGSPGRRKPIRYYGCSCHANRGVTICGNNHKARMEEAEEAVLARIEQDILTPDAIDYVVERATRLIAEQQAQDDTLPTRLEAEIRKEERKLQNFLALIAEGKAPASVLDAIRRLEETLRGKRAELERLTMAVPDELDLRRTKKQLHGMLGTFKDLIRADVPRARQALRKLLDGPIMFSPVMRDGRKALELQWKTRVSGLLDPCYIQLASPRGFEPLLPP